MTAIKKKKTTAIKPPPSLSSSSSSADVSFLDQPLPGVTILTAMIGWLVLSTILLPVALVGPKAHREINWLGYAVLGFNNLNILIALCEIALGKHIAFIKQHYQHLRQRYRKSFGGSGQEYQACFDYMTLPLSLRDVLFLDSQKWAIMWSTYSLWDPSYQNDESFGFFIDVGNGWSTIPSCLAVNGAILFPHAIQDVVGNRLLGMLGTASYWQVLYGTIIYFLSFLWNKRYQNKPLPEVLGFVGVANGIWFFFPIFALWACYQLIVHDATCVDVFHG